MQCVVPSCTDKRHIAARQVRWSVLSLSPQLQISNRELVEKWVEFNELRAISFPQEAKPRGRDASYLAPPRTEPYLRLSRIRLPPGVQSAKQLPHAVRSL